MNDKRKRLLLNEAEAMATVISDFGKNPLPESMPDVEAARAKLAGIEETLEAFGYRLGWRGNRLEICPLV